MIVTSCTEGVLSISRLGLCSAMRHIASCRRRLHTSTLQSHQSFHKPPIVDMQMMTGGSSHRMGAQS
jgi:hypothetical protein